MKMRNLQAIGWVMLLSVAVLATAQTPNRAPQDDKGAAKPAPAAPALPATNDADYVIGPDDTLSVNVWKEPEVSAPVLPVRPDGKISLPLINDVKAAGLTPMQLSQEITQRLKHYLDDPRVTVVVTAINSRRVFILGEVMRPGAFPLLPDMTVLQALSSAGGLAQYASRSKIYVLRNENGTQTSLPFNYKEVVRGKKPEENIVLKPGDTIVVP